VSPSWRESVRAALGPGEVGLVRLGAGWPQVVEGRVVPCAAPAAADPNKPDGPPWAPALAALRDGLAALDGRGGELTVVLSNHFVRYALLPWNEGLAGEAEELAYARHRFAQVYGEAAAQAWDIRVSPDGGGPQLACAVDAGLIAGLDEAAAAAGRRLRSVQPYLMAAYNRWRRALAGPLTWFVLAEPGRLCLAALQGGRWHDLANLRADAGWAGALPGLLARQRLLAGLDGAPGRVCVYAPDAAAEQALQQAGEAVEGLRLPPLRGLPAERAADLEMALNG